MLWAPEITLPYLPLPGDISSELMMYLGSGARRSQKRPSSASFLIPGFFKLLGNSEGPDDPPEPTPLRVRR